MSAITSLIQHQSANRKEKGTVLPPKRELLVVAAKRLLHRQAIRHLTNMLARLHSADTAHIIQHLESSEEKRTAFDCLPNDEIRGRVLSELDSDAWAPIILHLSSSRVASILQWLEPDDVAYILGKWPEEQRTQILSLMNQEDSSEVKDLLQYEEGTAGSIMTTEVFSLPEETTASEAISQLQQATEAETVFYMYVTDKEERLTGVLSLRRLLTVSGSTPLHALITQKTISVTPEMDQEEVARLVARYNLLALPVVDQEKVGSTVIRNEQAESAGTGVISRNNSKPSSVPAQNFFRER